MMAERRIAHLALGVMTSAIVLAACAPGAPGSPQTQGSAAAQAPGAGQPSQAGAVAAQAAQVGAGAQVAPPTPVPTATALPAPTVVPSPSPTPHALTIQAARARDYAGSDLTVEQVLAPGSNYDRSIVSYRSEGLKINALLTVPRGPKPATGWPVILFNHGYIPPAQYRTTERYIAYTDAFSRNGYIVLRSDYRGHGSSEGVARGGYGSPDYVTDVLNGMASVQRHPDADPERVGMWGHSMGGYITLRSMVVSPHVRAGVIWGGVVGSYQDMVFDWFGRSPFSPVPGIPSSATSWRRQLLDQYGGPDQNPGFWASLAANTYLADLSGPVQIHHGVNDADVPVRWSIALDEQVRQAGGYSELFTYPGDDHDISRNLGTALNRSVAFFDAHVKRR